MTAIAIDGPAGAGKSTVARAVAKALGFVYVDTGAMYRAIALCALRRDLDPKNAGALEDLARATEIEATEDRVTVDGRDVTAEIRSPEVTEVVSAVAVHPGVRDALVAAQRRFAGRADVVMEGRDIGSVVLPDAEVKVFLTASLEERAERRSIELRATGNDAAAGNVLTDIAQRDEADSTRRSSPLVRAEGAVEIDSTGRSVDEIVDLITDLVHSLGQKDG